MTNRFSILVFILLLSTLGRAQMILSGEVNANRPVHRGIYFLEDKEGKLGFADVLGQAGNFKPVEKDVPNFGISASTYWLRIQVQNKTHHEKYLLQIPAPNLDELELFQVDNTGNVKYQRGGEYLPFYYREFSDPDYIFRIKLDTLQPFSELYLRVKSKDNFQVPVVIGTQKSVFEANKLKDTFFGLYSGIMIVMFLYNMFLYFTVNDKTYLYYILYIATVFLTQIGIQGYGFQFLWPGSPLFAQYSTFIISPLSGITSAYFMRTFLNTAFFFPKLDKGFRYFTIAYAIAILLSLFRIFDFSFLLIDIAAFGICMYMMLIAILTVRKNYKPARFFLLAWTLFLFGVTIFAMTNLGVLPINNFTFYTMPLGSAAEVILLSLALADRINVLKKEKEQSQAEALLISQQNQKLITEQNIVLEQKVHERTLELEETNEELNVTLTYLKDTQTQLVDAEKMASLGQLTAGIAHEINNPINFVSANLKPLKMDISEVFDVITKYEAIKPDDALPQKLQEIDNFKKKIDLGYLRTEIETLLSGIEDGARRTAEIVSGLKNFSRLDESDMKIANINEGIESTLILVKGNIPKNIDVVTNLGDIPAIECLPGKLNQVFMNILTNAIYAMNARSTEMTHTLTISTYTSADHVCASFEDTGTGMTPEVKAKVFEPFFTTKDVGEGTGLGMSIVFKIIESHHAKIEIDSVPGQGTKITIILNKKIN